MKIIVRTDATSQIGTGHFMRCLALAQGLKDSGGDVVLITYCESEKLLERVKKEGFKLHVLKAIDSLKETEEILIKEKTNWMVLDGYHFNSEYQKAIKKLGYKLLVIDDYAHLDRYYADIILNQNYGAEKYSYNAGSHAGFLLGPQYALLRREFLEYMNFKREIPDTANKILITLGGSDTENHTLKVLKAVNFIEIPLNVRVVIGSKNNKLNSIKEEAKRSKHRIEIHNEVDNMAPFMAWADVAVSAGGTTTWELASMGLPFLLGIIADNQERAVNTLADAGFPTIGWIKENDINELSSLLNQLIHDKNLRERLSKNSRQLVDGKGVGRVIESFAKKHVRVLFLGSSYTKELSDWLKDHGEDVFYTEEKITPEFVEEISPDIIVSYNYKYILKKDILKIPPKGAINLHISYLPWNRGAHPNIWSYLENTPKGVTVHYIDEGVDTGDILLQKEVFIDEDKETLKTSYVILHKEIKELFKAHWEQIKSGEIKPKPQTQDGTLHYKKDSNLFEPFIKEIGWDIPIKKFKEKIQVSK